MATSPPSGYNPRDRRGRHRPADEPCRDCKTLLAWATTTRGSRIPLDVERRDPNAPPYLLLERAGEWRLAVRLDPELALEAEDLGESVRTSHFDTCQTRLERLRPPTRKDLD